MTAKLIAFFLLILATPVLAAAGWQADYGRLLKKYVTPEGVRYASWKKDAADMAALQGVVDAIAGAPSSNSASKEQLAFFINAYNAWILHEALAKYPTKSVKDTLFTFFLLDRIKVAGAQMSFNHLEKNIIRARFKEPRIHFALNCASRSCPPLPPEPLDGAKLDKQLDQLAKNFVNSDRGVRPMKDGVEVSMIFDWYNEDFAARGGVVAFINKYRTPAIPTAGRLTYQKYNWSLNEVK